MVRPCKCRKVYSSPRAEYFKPRGVPICELDEVTLKVDEYEAVRLADLEECYQEDAAKRMCISRQTFGNIIMSAHKKIADAIINAKALKIEGGFVKLSRRKRCCRKQLRRQK